MAKEQSNAPQCSMKKLKIGDRVKIVSSIDSDPHLGQTGIVSELHCSAGDCTTIKLDMGGECHGNMQTYKILKNQADKIPVDYQDRDDI